MRKMFKGKVTLEKLATMVANGFSDVDKRFEQIDKRFEQVDKRFDRLESRMDGLERRIDDLVDTKVSWDAHNSLADPVTRLEISSRKK